MASVPSGTLRSCTQNDPRVVYDSVMTVIAITAPDRGDPRRLFGSPESTSINTNNQTEWYLKLQISGEHDPRVIVLSFDNSIMTKNA